LVENPQSTAKAEQSQFVRDETDLAIKTLQKWHHQHPDAQPTHLAAVVGRLAEKLLQLQSPSPSPPSPPRPQPSLPPPPPKIKKKPLLKPPARKKRPAQPRPSPSQPPQSTLFAPSHNNYPIYDYDYQNKIKLSDSQFTRTGHPLHTSTIDHSTNINHFPPRPRYEHFFLLPFYFIIF
jgi:hypothetical protein